MDTIKINGIAYNYSLFLASMRIYYSIFLLICTSSIFAQKSIFEDAYVSADYFYGSILKHNKNIGQLIHEHPTGVLLSYNKRTFGNKRWEQEYNYPDWGVSFLYQDFHFENLGQNYSVAFHYNFYFLKRKLQLRIGEGINYNTNPFDLETNFKNTAYGSHLTGFTQIGVQYHQPRIIGNIGLQAGILFLHHSNGSFKAPNSGTNVFATSIGLVYDFEETPKAYIKTENLPKIKEPIRYNIAIRGGINASDVFNLGEHPFFILSGYADKRLSFKSTIQLGAEIFVSQFLKNQLEYEAAAFPNRNIDPTVDFKRIGVFAGHEFRFNKVALPTQLGYYVYNPSGFARGTYIRAGVKYYISSKWFVDGTVKTHGFNAEAIEFGLGIRI